MLSWSTFVQNKDHSDTPGPGNLSAAGKTAEAVSGDPAIPLHSHGGRRAGAGGKPLDFDLNLVRNLSRIQCTDEEIAAVLHVSERTIQRHKKRPEFREAMEAGKAEGRVSTRRQLFKLAEGGNVAATICLAKNLLGYRNAVEFRAPDPAPDDVRRAMDDLRALYGLTSEPTPTSTNTDSIEGDS
jgi:hypothetical protein